MKQTEFKVGDKVYYPLRSNKIHTLVKNDYTDKYCLRLEFDDGDGCTFLENGLDYTEHTAPSIFHATQENYELLSKLYPSVEFEPPPKRKEPKEIVQAMFDGGWKYVVISQDGYDRSISDISHCAHTVIPIDPKTGKVIVDFVDGEIVLEDK